MDKELLVAIGALLEPVKQDINGLRQDFSGMKSQQEDDHAILRALEDASNVHKAELDNLTYAVAHVEGRLTTIESDVKELKDDVKELKDDVKELKDDVKELKDDVGDIKDAQREFYEMYGDHETQIRELRRKVAGS